MTRVGEKLYSEPDHPRLKIRDLATFLGREYFAGFRLVIFVVAPFWLLFGCDLGVS